MYISFEYSGFKFGILKADLGQLVVDNRTASCMGCAHACSVKFILMYINREVQP